MIQSSSHGPEPEPGEGVKVFAESFDIFLMRRFTSSFRNDCGFTMIELLIVMAIIGLLAAIAIPQYTSYKIHAFNVSAQADLVNAVKAQEAAFVDRQEYGNCMDAGCEPALPGFKLTNGVSIACTPRNDNAVYQCSARHNSGDVTFYYDSELSVYWEM